MGSRYDRYDWHGLSRRYRRRSDSETSASLAPLVTPSSKLSRRGVLASFGEAEAPDSTVFEDVSLTARSLAPVPRPPRTWAGVLRMAVGRIARGARRPALCLGGGLDSAVVAASWTEQAFAPLTLYTLRTAHPGYDEVEDARSIADALSLPLEVIELDDRALLDGLRGAVRAFETPLYNLHPAARHGLAVALAARGHDLLVTGDGADALFRAAPDDDYVPLIARSARSVGLELRSPFLDPELVAATVARPADEGRGDKRALRQLARGLGLPSWLTDRPKASRSYPALDLSGRLREAPLQSLAEELDLPPDLSTDRARVGWLTLSMLAADLRGTA